MFTRELEKIATGSSLKNEYRMEVVNLMLSDDDEGKEVVDLMLSDDDEGNEVVDLVLKRPRHDNDDASYALARALQAQDDAEAAASLARRLEAEEAAPSDRLGPAHHGAAARPLRLRRGVDCMVRVDNLTRFFAAADLERATRGVRGFRSFLRRSVVEQGFRTLCRAPLRAELSSLEPALDAMEALLEEVHGDDDARWIQLFVNRYRDGTEDTGRHSHYCRQLTVSVGAPRVLRIDGPGVAGGRRDVLMRTGTAVLLDGQFHSVPGDRTVDERFSLNLFYALASDYERVDPGDPQTQRRGRSLVSAARWTPAICAHRDPCRRCGFHHGAGACVAAPLGPDWNG